MQLNELKFPGFRKSSRRIGRGGKRGTYSGRGNKGQRSRSGARIRPAIRDIIKRIPKKRGYKFASPTGLLGVVNLGQLNQNFNENDLINIESLRQKGLIGRARDVKVLAKGELTKKLNFKSLQFSETAKKAITKAGGTIV